MQHCTPEQLALAALREPLPADDAAHLASCARCRTEVASLQRGVGVLAVPQLAAPGASVPPPPRVWEAIAAATGVSATPDVAAAPDAQPSTVAEPPVQAPALTDVRFLRVSRGRLLTAAAAVAVVAAGAAGIVAITRGDDEVPVAATALAPLDAAHASGRASVVERKDGSRDLVVRLDAPALKGSYYEVWLLEPSITGMVQVGAVRPGTTDLPLPDGLDLRQFPLVDVSVEPLDGVPTHSGVSVVRGELNS